MVKRRIYEKLYGHLYKRPIEFGLDKCAYCNFPREAFDHVPALALIDGIDIGEYTRRGGKFILYPSCRQCNSFLSVKAYIDYVDRLNYLDMKYLLKIKQIEWSKKELSSMTGMMKAYIEANQFKVDVLLQKVRNIGMNILKQNQ